MGTSPQLFDRETEQRELRRLAESGTMQLALLTGRRRVGKTFLLANMWRDRDAFLFTASRTTGELNRRQIVEDLAAWSGEPLSPADFPTWRAVFNLLLDIRSPDPLVIILDEFQYLAEDSGADVVASELNAAWERRRPARPLLVVLSGSVIGVMEELAAGGGPLYGRFAWQHRLLPFGYLQASEMAAFQSLRDRALAYGIFGGTPRYLAAVDPTESLSQNATRLLLDRSGEVRLLVETALDQEYGLRDTPRYRAVLRAVAAGCTERNEIAQRSGLTNDQALRDKLSRLVDLGYLETRQNFEPRSNEPLRYGIADPAFRFHQRFVEPALSMLERYPASQIWRSSVDPALDSYMGHEFERIAVQAYDRRHEKLDLPPVRNWGRWEGTDRSRRSLEIDVVARLADGRVLTGAVKWNREPIPASVHIAHMTMLHRVADSGRKWAHEALDPASPIYYVAAGGFSDEFLKTVRSDGRQVICWDLEELYAAAER